MQGRPRTGRQTRDVISRASLFYGLSFIIGDDDVITIGEFIASHELVGSHPLAVAGTIKSGASAGLRHG